MDHQTEIRPPGQSKTRTGFPSVRVDERLLHHIGVREWGMPTGWFVGKLWRSEEKKTITCIIPAGENSGKTETLPLEVVPPGHSQWMPDHWRAALWEYVQQWPSSGCYCGPFLAISEAQRCDFIRKMAADLVKSDNIGCRSIADGIGMLAAYGYELPENPKLSGA